MEIRRATSEDADAVYEMMCKLEEQKLNKEKFETTFEQNIKNRDIHYFIAEEKKNPVGFISLHIQNPIHHDGMIGEIHELFVDPEIRGEGIGAELITFVRNVASKKGCESLEVTCNVNRKRTHDFYQREGLDRTHFKFTDKL